MIVARMSGGRSEISFGFSWDTPATSGEGHTAFSSGTWCASVVAVVIPPITRVPMLRVTSELILVRGTLRGARRCVCVFGSSHKSVTILTDEKKITIL